MMPLTDRQREALDFIVEQQRKGVQPSFREIADSIGGAHIGTAQQLLKSLQEKGYIEKPPKGRSRSIKVLDTGRAETLWGSFPV